MKTFHTHSGERYRFFLIVSFLVLLVTACQPEPGTTNTQIPAMTGTVVATRQMSKTPKATSSPSINTESGNEMLGTITVEPKILVNPEDLRGITISFWHPWTGMSAYQTGLLVDQFNQSNQWGIEVKVEISGGASALFTSVSDALRLGVDQPSVIAAPIETLVEWEQDDDIVVDLTDYIQDPTWGMSDQEIADFSHIFWSQDNVGGSQLGIPASRTVQVLFYNQSWAQELGFSEAPGTTEDFMEQVCAAANAYRSDETLENDGIGGWLVNTDSLTMLAWMYAFGDLEFPENDSQEYHFNNQVGLDTFEFIRTMIDEGCAWTGKSTEPYTYFAKRQALFYSGVLEEVDRQESAMSLVKNQDTWAIIPYPNNNSDKPVVIASGPSYSILEGSPEENLAAWLLIRYIASADSQIKLIQMDYSLPVRVQVAQSLSVFTQYHPQWGVAQSWLPVVLLPPKLGSWRYARNVLEDAAWQCVQSQTTVEAIPGILQELDATIEEVLKENGH